MTNIKYTDSDGEERYSYSTHAGTDIDPDESPEQIIDVLAEIETAVDGLEALATTGNASLVTIAGHVDGIETAIGTTNTTLTTLAGYVDALETLIAATNTALSTLGGYQDGVETLLGTTNTNLTTLAGHVDGLEALVTLLNGYIDGLESLTGALTETAPATDTASSGLNGRLQRIAQRLTSLIAQVGPRAAASTNVHVPSSNTAAVITYAAAGAGVSHVISGIAWSYSAAPTAGNLKVEDGSGTTVFSIDITAAGPGFIPFAAPLKGTANTAMIITLAAGGSGVSGKVNSLGKWTE